VDEDDGGGVDEIVEQLVALLELGVGQGAGDE
jgi:hypothetical protein